MSEHDVARQANRRYLTVWRWHFYAGLFVMPFLMILAATGLAMMLFAQTEGRDGEQIAVNPQAVVQPLSRQAEAARNAVHTEAEVVSYIAPRTPDQVAVFRVKNGDESVMAAVNPYTAEVLKTYPRRTGIYHVMEGIHGDLFLGTTGDYLLETAASLTILMLISGIYLWQAKQDGLKKLFFPAKAAGRARWRNWHGVLGAWVSLILLLFCLSGLAWSGIWGERAVQAWNQFPAGKWGIEPMPESDVLTHGRLLNEGKIKDVPWVLEFTPVPRSGSTRGENGIRAGEPLTLDTLDRFAREIGLAGRYQLNLPKGDTGVWTLSQDSMSYDGNSPFIDRTVHIDRYSGRVLADIRYDDYSALGKLMAVGIALHMGTLGWWSVLANTLFCLTVMFLCISGVVMWWRRRPQGVVGLLPPARPRDTKVWCGMAVALLLTAALFPTALIAIAVMALLDFVLLSRVPVLQKWFK